MTTRAEVVAEARSWIGTRHVHQSRLKGIGVDCIGLPLEVAHNLDLLPKDLVVEGYSPVPDGYSILAWCDRYIPPRVPRTKMQPGDIVIVAFESRPQHAGIVGDYVHGNGALSIIHALDRVVETRLLFHGGMHFIAAYSLPGVE